MADHWSESFIGDPYIKGEADCGRLVCRVRREVFGLPVPDEAEFERAASRLGRVAQMSDAVAAFGQRVERPVEGDAVLMLCRGRASHIGIFCVVDEEACVLHAMGNARMVVRHAIRDLPRVGLLVEGCYRWK